MNTLTLDIRAKLIAAFVLVLFIVTSAPPSLARYLTTVAALALVALIIGCPLWRVGAGMSAALLFTAFIAATAPLALVNGDWSWPHLTVLYRDNWTMALAIPAKATLSAGTVAAVVGSVSKTELLAGLDALRIPTIFITMISFMLRFTELFIEQLRSLRQAVASRAPNLGRVRRLLTYGKLGGNLFVRSYERGERVHDAMLARGYTGRLPVHVLAELQWRMVDTLALLFAVVMGLYYALF
jgi:cobalt/nickel transport system permease protein